MHMKYGMSVISCEQQFTMFSCSKSIWHMFLKVTIPNKDAYCLVRTTIPKQDVQHASDITIIT